MGRAEHRKQPLGGLVLEAFERVSLFEMKQRVLERALAEAKLTAVPEQIEHLTFFVSGPLYEHAQRTLGTEFADSLLLELSPVLDRAWQMDRERVELSKSPPPPAMEATPEGASTTIRTRSRSAIRRVDDEGGPPSAIDAVRDTDPVREADTDPAPSSRRNTVPYVESVLAQETISDAARRQPILVVHDDDQRRRDIASAVERAGDLVVTAPDARVAALFVSRIGPSAVIADAETIAPDFEPIGPVLEALLKDATAPVVLLSDHRRPDLPASVQAIVSVACAPDEIAAVVDRLLQR